MIEEMLSFWNWWEKCKRGNNRGNQEKRDERLEEEIESDHPEEENIEREE
ncbi:hypothetical protein ES707_16962 [subsurface metagenome]